MQVKVLTTELTPRMPEHRLPLSTVMKKVVGGSPNAGNFLYRLVWWDRHSTIVRDGKRWVIHTREWWMDELDITVAQHKEAMKAIMATGLVEREYHLFGGARMTHLRLNDEGRRFAQLAAKFNTDDTIEAFLKMAEVGNPTIPMGDIPPDPMGGIPTTHKEEQGETYREKQQGGDTSLGKDIEVAKMAEVPETVGAKRSKSADRNKTIGSELYEIWCDVM